MTKFCVSSGMSNGFFRALTDFKNNYVHYGPDTAFDQLKVLLEKYPGDLASLAYLLHVTLNYESILYVKLEERKL